MTERAPLRPVLYDEGRDLVRLLDQRRLPAEETWLELSTAEQVADAIRTLAVRGAPAIGVAAAYGLAVEARRGADAFRLVSVRLGPEQSGQRVVLSGLKGDEQVVVDGAFHLNNERNRKEMEGS